MNGEMIKLIAKLKEQMDEGYIHLKIASKDPKVNYTDKYYNEVLNFYTELINKYDKDFVNYCENKEQNLQNNIMKFKNENLKFISKESNKKYKGFAKYLLIPLVVTGVIGSCSRMPILPLPIPSPVPTDCVVTNDEIVEVDMMSVDDYFNEMMKLEENGLLSRGSIGVSQIVGNYDAIKLDNHGYNQGKIELNSAISDSDVDYINTTFATVTNHNISMINSGKTDKIINITGLYQKDSEGRKLVDKAQALTFEAANLIKDNASKEEFQTFFNKLNDVLYDASMSVQKNSSASLSSAAIVNSLYNAAYQNNKITEKEIKKLGLTIGANNVCGNMDVMSKISAEFRQTLKKLEPLCNDRVNTEKAEELQNKIDSLEKKDLGGAASSTDKMYKAAEINSSKPGSVANGAFGSAGGVPSTSIKEGTTTSSTTKEYAKETHQVISEKTGEVIPDTPAATIKKDDLGNNLSSNLSSKDGNVISQVSNQVGKKDTVEVTPDKIAIKTEEKTEIPVGSVVVSEGWANDGKSNENKAVESSVPVAKVEGSTEVTPSWVNQQNQITIK